SPAWDNSGLVGVAVTLAMALAVGGLNGLGIVFLRVHPLILTLATATILQGMLLLIAGGSAISTTNPAVIWLANARILGVPTTILTWLIVAAVVLVLLHRTVFGAWIYAMGINDWASRLSGANVRATTIATYALSGFFSGVAGLLLLGAGFAGRVVLVGDEAYPPYERPPLSKKLLMGEVGLETTFLRPATHYAEQGIELQLGRRATSIARAERRIDFAAGEPLFY